MLSMSFDFSETNTSRPGSLNGGGRSSTALNTLKIAVFAPMPSASVSTATAVKPGFFSSWRKANLRSFITQRLHRIDTRCPQGRDQTRRQSNADEQQYDAGESQRIGRCHRIKLRAQKPGQSNGQRGAAQHADQHS